ncbi:MAG: hypothetical protein JJU11_10900, partial [Candidatus Sumerlaeia bacterium]|nr:hypothetical protein [Candidatus Sumerlaeia bacterium]
MIFILQEILAGVHGGSHRRHSIDWPEGWFGARSRWGGGTISPQSFTFPFKVIFAFDVGLTPRGQAMFPQFAAVSDRIRRGWLVGVGFLSVESEEVGGFRSGWQDQHQHRAMR